jgi:hypothetical protein
MEADLVALRLGVRLAGVLVPEARLRGVPASEPPEFWMADVSRFLRSFWTCWL